MPTTTKSQKPAASKVARTKSSKGKGKASEKTVPKVVELDEDDESDDEEDGVNEEGMARLMRALGDDGLDEFERAQLRALGGEDEWETDEEEGDEKEGIEEEANESGDDSEAEGEHSEEDQVMNEESIAKSNAEPSEEDELAEGDVALEDVDSVDEDAVPRQKIEIDNTVALERIRETIQLDPSLPWTETLVISYPESIDVDVDDDLNRELAFYKQALHSANAARSLAEKHNLPFTRPSDYFAEMVKSDSHMERIRQRLLDETAGIKKSEEKRKEREGKKFGKQVQLEKLKEREKGKKEMEERLKGLKRKRKDTLDNPQADDDAFDVAVEDAISDHPSKRGKGGRGGRIPREARNQKFGFGGAGKRSKQNTKDSTDNFEFSGSRGRGGFRGGGRGGGRGGARGGDRGSERGGGRGGRGGGRGGARGGAKRPGKSRRMDARSKA